MIFGAYTEVTIRDQFFAFHVRLRGYRKSTQLVEYVNFVNCTEVQFGGYIPHLEASWSFFRSYLEPLGSAAGWPERDRLSRQRDRVA